MDIVACPSLAFDWILIYFINLELKHVQTYICFYKGSLALTIGKQVMCDHIIFKLTTKSSKQR